ncbi:hypothetical protein [Hymenobacter arcticus]
MRDLLYGDIFSAQQIEQKKPGARRSDEPIDYEFSNDSLHRAYHFANLRALRISIKHRVDSLRAAGVKISSHDTIRTMTATHGVMVIEADNTPLAKHMLNFR